MFLSWGFGSNSAPLVSLTHFDNYLDDGVTDIAAGRMSPVYGMNFSATSAHIPTYLSTVPFNRKSAVHPCLGLSPGMNIPS